MASDYEDELEQFKSDIKDHSFAEVLDLLIQKRIQVSQEPDLVDNLKIRELKRELNDRFLKRPSDSSNSDRSGVSEVSSIVSKF